MRSAGSALLLVAIAACGAPEVADDELAAGLVADPELLAIEASGTWDDEGPGGEPVVRAWVDARVANRRYAKRVLVEVAAPHPAGWVRTLHPASHEGDLGGGFERWGADTIELFPGGGPGGGVAGPVIARVRLQHDVDGDGVDEMVLTPWRRLWGDGELAAPADDPWLEVDSPAAPDGAPTDVVFAPFDDPGRALLAELDAVIARQRAAPGERHTVHLAVFNITDDELIDRLIEAHDAGVEVRVVFDGRKLRPWYGWYQGDDRLIAAGVPVLGALRPGGAMHDKIALFDGRRVATGSMNWEPGARRDNHEALFVTGDPELVAAYAARMTALAGGPLAPRRHAVDPAAPASVSFAPDEAPHAILGRLIDGATRTIHVAMFTCKDVAYDDGAGPTSLFAKLAAARDLFRQYDPAWDPAEWPQVRVRFAVRDDRTRWGDTVAVVGDLPELGGWDPGGALLLDPATWPVWTGEVVLPAGVHLTWKALTRHADAAVTWEPGDDRRATVPADAAEVTLAIDAR